MALQSAPRGAGFAETSASEPTFCCELSAPNRLGWVFSRPSVRLPMSSFIFRLQFIFFFPPPPFYFFWPHQSLAVLFLSIPRHETNGTEEQRFLKDTAPSPCGAQMQSQVLRFPLKKTSSIPCTGASPSFFFPPPPPAPPLFSQ